MITCLIIAETATASVLSSYINRFHLVLTLQGSSDLFEDGLKLVSRFKPGIVYIEDKIMSQRARELQPLKTQCFFVILSEINLENELANSLAFDCLIKPLKFSDFTNSIKKYGAYLYKSVMNGDATLDSVINHVKLKDRNLKDVLIAYTDLLYIQAMENYVKYHTINGEFYIKKTTMTAMLTGLPPDSFSRVHKSHVINDHFIGSINRHWIYLNDVKKTRIPIGQKYKVAFLVKENIRHFTLQSKLKMGKIDGGSNYTGLLCIALVSNISYFIEALILL